MQRKSVAPSVATSQSHATRLREGVVYTETSGALFQQYLSHQTKLFDGASWQTFLQSYFKLPKYTATKVVQFVTDGRQTCLMSTFTAQRSR